MKLKALTLAIFTLITTSASANLVRLSERITNQAQMLERTTNDFRDGLVRRRAVRMQLNQLKEMVNRMDKRLRNHNTGPIGRVTASCSLDVGGNFLTPKSQVECTVYGRGALGYEVRVTGDYINTIAFQGTLQPGQNTQQMVTSKEKVGGHSVRYDVYVITRGQGRTHVATLGRR